MQHLRRRRRRPRAGLAATAVAVAALLTGACAAGFGPARDDPAVAPPAADGSDVRPAPDAPDASPPPAIPGSGVPAPASDPAAVAGADRFGVVATDDFCSAAPKVATAFEGLFSSVYAGQGSELQAQVESTLVGIDVLRAVAPDDVAADLDTSRAFLARFHEILTQAGWSLQAAAQAHPEFFGGSEPDAGFAALTSVTQAINVHCGTGTG